MERMTTTPTPTLTPQSALQRATSRKLWIAIGTLATVLTGVELTDRQAIVIVAIAIAYIFAEAAVDWQRARRGILIDAPSIEAPKRIEATSVLHELPRQEGESIEARARALLKHFDEGGTPTREHVESMRELLSANDSLRADAATEGTTNR